MNPSGYLVTFTDGLGHPKEMIFLAERKHAADDAAARLHGTCIPLYKPVIPEPVETNG